MVLQGYWLDEDSLPVDGTIKLDPVPLTGQGAIPNLKDSTSFSYIQTKSRVATPNPTTGYFAVLALASNDPDVDAYGGRKVTFTGYTPYTIQVPYNAPTTTVTSAMAAQVPSLTVGQTVRALWLIDAPDGSTPPAPVSSYYTSDQVNSLIAGVSGGPSLTTQLTQWTYAQAFQLVSATRDANEAITTASIVWPDGATGTFTTDTASTAFPGAVDAFHVTHVLSGATKTITQPAVTRDAGGAVTAQPALTVA